MNELRTTLAESQRMNQTLSKSANSSESKGAIISELRANLVDRERLVQSIEEQKNSLVETKKSTETIVSELKVSLFFIFIIIIVFIFFLIIILTLSLSFHKINK